MLLQDLKTMNSLQLFGLLNKLVGDTSDESVTTYTTALEELKGKVSSESFVECCANLNSTIIN